MRLGSYCRVLSLVQNMQTLGQFFEPLYDYILSHEEGEEGWVREGEEREKDRE